MRSKTSLRINLHTYKIEYRPVVQLADEIDASSLVCGRAAIVGAAVYARRSVFKLALWYAVRRGVDGGGNRRIDAHIGGTLSTVSTRG